MSILKKYEIKDEYRLIHKLKYIFDNSCMVCKIFSVNDLIYDGTTRNYFTFDDKLKKETINDILNTG